MDCNKTDCIHRKVCEEWKSLGNDIYINESYGNCDCYNDDLISRSALKRAACVKFYTSPYYKHILDLIDNAPTVKPKKGKWICITKNTEYIQMWYCSECGRTVEMATVLDPDIFFPFCHCGADMRVAEDDTID